MFMSLTNMILWLNAAWRSTILQRPFTTEIVIEFEGMYFSILADTRNQKHIILSKIANTHAILVRVSAIIALIVSIELHIVSLNCQMVYIKSNYFHPSFNKILIDELFKYIYYITQLTCLQQKNRIKI
jgi:hypothetical protein